MERFYIITRQPVLAKLKMAHTQPDFHGNQTILNYQLTSQCVKDHAVFWLDYQNFHLYYIYAIVLSQRGSIETLSSDHPRTQAHYLPCHPVKKDSVTTPIRVVFDGSCRQGKGSANLIDCLLVGPPFLNYYFI